MTESSHMSTCEAQQLVDQTLWRVFVLEPTGERYRAKFVLEPAMVTDDNPNTFLRVTPIGKFACCVGSALAGV